MMTGIGPCVIKTDSASVNLLNDANENIQQIGPKDIDIDCRWMRKFVEWV